MVVQIATGQPVIQAEGLRKRYGSTVAVDGVDLIVYQGEIFGILGPNGAGKTTTLEIFEGLRQPDQGSVRIAGLDAATDIKTIRSLIGVQLQTTALFDYLTAAELIRLFASLYGASHPDERVDTLLAMVGLEEKRNARVQQMSGGQQQRLSIALGLVNEPVVAFLDEPTTGLDPGARRDLWQTIQQIRAGGTTVVLTTHYMEEAEVLCDRVAIMDFGQIIALDAPRELIRQLGAAATIRATVVSGGLQPADFDQLPDVTDVSMAESEIALGSTDVQSTLVALLDLAARKSIQLADLRTSQATLEDVFLQLTGRAYVSETEADNNDAPPAAQQSRLFGRSR